MQNNSSIKAARLFLGLWIAIGACNAIVASAQIVVSDNYDVTQTGSGFGLGSGVNAGINPPATRLTGAAALGLRYVKAFGTKDNNAHTVSGDKLVVSTVASLSSTLSLSTNTAPYDFGSFLGTASATPAQPSVYEITVKIANATTGTPRCSFALSSVAGTAGDWDFGIQLYRASSSATNYTLQKRVSAGSSGGSALNSVITTVGKHGHEVAFLIRVTDAGRQTNAFNSRVQVSINGGTSWIYDSNTDSELPNGWRLSGAARHVFWDVAGGAGLVSYDDFSVRMISGRVPTSTLVSPANNATNLGSSPQLRTVVTNSMAGDLTVTFFGREVPRPFPGPDFCIPVLPDTQNYSREAPDDASRQMWYAQTDWIVNNRISENIAYVAHLGDIVQSGDIKNGNPNTLEWSIATNAMYRLERPSNTLLTYGIPYGLAVGNHDQEPLGDENGTTTFYNNLFGISHFSGRPYYGGNFSDNNDSHFDLFSASGLHFIVLYFEYGRYGSSIINWANSILATNQHRRAIVVTHHAGSANTPSSFSAQGSALYEGLKANTNFFMMLGGHVTGEGSRQNTFNGNTVRTFISDYQGRPNGGNGWMRLMYFSPSNNQVVIQTFSPWLNLYETDANSEMFFTYNLQLPTGPGSQGTPYAILNAQTGIAPGSTNSFGWTGVQPNRTYEWYVTVTDGIGNIGVSPVRRFSTGLNAAPTATHQNLTIVGDQPANLTLSASDSNGDALTFQLMSQPVRGLNTNFDPAGGTVTYLPAHGYRGLDRFTYRASDGLTNSPTVNFDLNVIAPADLNTNGLPDSWESIFGVSDPNADDDGDGQSNLAEYIANTNPTNAASLLKIIEAKQTNGFFNMTWSAVGGTRYRIQYSNGDAAGGITNSFTDLIRFIDSEMNSAPYGSNSTQSFTDNFTQTGITTNGIRYYLIKVVP